MKQPAIYKPLTQSASLLIKVPLCSLGEFQAELDRRPLWISSTTTVSSEETSYTICQGLAADP
jgi:hypothetical protein